MIFVKSQETDPYYNLALEDYLLDVSKNNHCVILYLWQNERTIVIGRNQNAYTECNVDYAEQNGIRIARRKTGGGAVYHDLGNLNYSIIMPKDIFNIEKNNELLIKVLYSLGLEIIKTGRNDFLVNNKKVSGNAYYFNECVGLHHGTLLVDSNLDVLERALSTNACKSTIKGVHSIKSAVANISDFLPSISIDIVESTIINVFACEYGQAKRMESSYSLLSDRITKFKSVEWIFGEYPEYSFNKKTAFAWGYAEFGFKMVGQIITEVLISSDSIDFGSIEFANNYINKNLEYINKNKRIELLANIECDVCNELIKRFNEYLREIF